MRVLKSLALFCAVACGLNVAAQNADYNLVGISYTNIGLHPKGGDNISLNGFSLGYTRGFAVSQNLPIYVETGLKFAMGFHTESEGHGKDKYSVTETLGSLSVPVNAAYKFGINDSFSVKPYLGLNVKVNVLGQSTMKDGSDKDTWNWFGGDDDYMDFKRFQLGWHIGVGAQYSNYYLGLDYGTDFIKLADEISSGTFNLTLGYCF